ncbi:MAG: hypothetical protein Crog4KO_21470 [Crocinitomicaceae bacterium]
MMKATTIFLLLCLASCTITKRVHRPGYHIEWKKNYRAQNTPNKENESASKAESEHLETSELELKKSDVATPKQLELQPLMSFEREESAFQQESTELDVNPNTDVIVLKQSRRYAPFERFKNRKKSTSKRSISNALDLELFGYWMLGIAAFLLLGTFFAYFGLWALESLFYNLVFGGNGLIAGILGFFIFLIVLVVVFIAYAIVEYLMGSYIIGLIVSGALAAVGGVSLWISNY